MKPEIAQFLWFLIIFLKGENRMSDFGGEDVCCSRQKNAIQFQLEFNYSFHLRPQSAFNYLHFFFIFYFKAGILSYLKMADKSD